MSIREYAFSCLAVALLSTSACGDDGTTSNGNGSSGAGDAGTATGGDDPGGQSGATGRGGSAGSAGSAGTTAGSGASSGAGGEGGSGSLPGPPTLIRTAPEPDQTNVWFYAPIELVFSEVLDPVTIGDDSVAVTVAGERLPGSLALSADGTTIALELAEPPVMGATATLEIQDTIADLDGETFAGATFDYVLPLWQRPGTSVADGASAPLVATAPGGALFVARNEGGELLVDAFDGSAWQPLDGLDAMGAGDAALASDASGRPLVAFARDATGTEGSIAVQRWNGSSWQPLGEPTAATGASGLTLAHDADGDPVLAWAEAGAVHVERLAGGTWQALGDPLVVAASFGMAVVFGFTMDGDAPVVAHFVASTGTGVLTPAHLRIERFDGGWVPLGADIARSRTSSLARPSLASAADGVLYVAFDDGDAVTSNGLVRRRAAGATRNDWEPLGHALDLVLDAEVATPKIAVSAEGELFATWTETHAGSSKAYAARWDENGWTMLAEALNLRDAARVSAAALALDEHGHPNVAFLEDGALFVKRYNGSPTLPFGLARRASTAGCVIPPDTSMAFPQTLAATGCYADVPGRVPVPGAIPFELNSPLWSDGAAKRRYLVLPDGATIGYAAPGAFSMPVDTIIIKEFLYPTVAGDASTLVPMETRFLVKRCDDAATGCENATAWQGYSYQWNAEHTEAALLPDAASTLAWPYSDAGNQAMHVHSYPSRQQCVQCHNQPAGRVLGLQAGQLDRSLDYGGVIDNQLRALEHIGVLTGMASSEPVRLPAPNDQSFSLEERARGYFHANCSHCHRAGGMQLTVDFRYEAPLSATNICNKLVPGDPDQSRVYRKDAYRGPAPMPASGSEPGGGNQMPPLATLIQDPRQLAVTHAWIDGMQSCP